MNNLNEGKIVHKINNVEFCISKGKYFLISINSIDNTYYQYKNYILNLIKNRCGLDKDLLYAIFKSEIKINTVKDVLESIIKSNKLLLLQYDTDNDIKISTSCTDGNTLEIDAKVIDLIQTGFTDIYDMYVDISLKSKDYTSTLYSYIDNGFSSDPLLIDNNGIPLLSLTYNNSMIINEEILDAKERSCLLKNIYDEYRKFNLTVDQASRKWFRTNVMNEPVEVGIELVSKVSHNGIELSFPYDKSLYKIGQVNIDGSFTVDGHMTGQYQVHSHPSICYSKYNCSTGWPSSMDYMAVFNTNTILHMVESMEGTYTIQITPEARGHYLSLPPHRQIKFKELLNNQTKEYEKYRHKYFPILQIYSSHSNFYKELDRNNIKYSEDFKKNFNEFVTEVNKMGHLDLNKFNKSKRTNELYNFLLRNDIIGSKSNGIYGNMHYINVYINKINNYIIDDVKVLRVDYFKPEQFISINDVECIGQVCGLTSSMISHEDIDDINRFPHTLPILQKCK